MSDTVRRALFFAAAVALAVVLARGVIRMPAFGDYHGPYGLILNQIAVPQRHVTNVVASVNFDYRGIDTVGEEFILFASVAGVLLLLRVERDEAEQERSDGDAPQTQASDDVAPASLAVSAVCQALIAPTVVFGLYIISHGQLTPGGGFQGGAALASAFLLLFLGGEYHALRTLIPHDLGSAADAIGAGGFVVIGCIGLLFGAAFLQNVLPLGPVGVIYSAGTIPLINLSVGLEVCAGFVLILLEFLRQTLDLRQRQLAEQSASGKQRTQERQNKQDRLQGQQGQPQGGTAP